MNKYENHGKQVMYRADSGELIPLADARDNETSQVVAAAMNGRSEYFIADALRTLSPNWHGELVSKSNWISALNQAIEAANKLDKIKKTLFYGRDNNLNPAEGQADVRDLPLRIVNGEIIEESLNGAANIIHAIIGKFTEAGELLEALKAAINDQSPLDRVNVLEEIGDGFWYDAILLNEYDSTFEEEQSRVIAKLKARFPDKFTNENANVRDLERERVVLEAGDIGNLNEILGVPLADEAVDFPVRLTGEHGGIDFSLAPSEPASGPEAVKEAAERSKAAFAAVNNVGASAQPEPEPNPEHAKSIAERSTPMPQENMAQQNGKSVPHSERGWKPD